MSDRVLRENIAHLTRQLMSETFSPKRQQLARRIKKEVEKLAAIDRTEQESPNHDGEYWKSRAERARQRARRHQDEGFRDYLLKIATGYDELAKQAHGAPEARGGENY